LDHVTGLVNAFMLAIVKQMTVEKLFRQSGLTPHPCGESDIIYMLKSLID
jgi:hypothetical protein